jgi:hypothetical protein
MQPPSLLGPAIRRGGRGSIKLASDIGRIVNRNEVKARAEKERRWQLPRIDIRYSCSFLSRAHLRTRIANLVLPCVPVPMRLPYCRPALPRNKTLCPLHPRAIIFTRCLIDCLQIPRAATILIVRENPQRHPGAFNSTPPLPSRRYYQLRGRRHIAQQDCGFEISVDYTSVGGES